MIRKSLPTNNDATRLQKTTDPDTTRETALTFVPHFVMIKR
jgi:hypothetical protein